MPSQLAITPLSIVALRKNPKNPRHHSPRQIKQIAQSIKSFGFLVPVLVDRDNKVLAGHGRVLAAEHLGYHEVPSIRIDHLTPEQERAFSIADNRLTENSSWNDALLAESLKELSALELDFSIEATGFTMGEIDFRIEAAGSSSANSEEDISQEIPAGPPVSQPGDLWQLGPHRLLCGSALEEASYSTLMHDQKAGMVFTDPPYNVPIQGHVGCKGRIRHREFAMASGEMSHEEFTAFLTKSLKHLADFSRNGSLHYICMDWRHLPELLSAGNATYSELKNLCVWVKTNGGMGSLYRSRHELVLVFKNGTGTHRNNVALGVNGRNRTNVWEYPGINTLAKQGDEGNLLALHPTVKPVRLVADAILDCTSRGDIVLDAFLGSGSTLIAAERMGRRCYGLELDPLYVDCAIRRWQQQTGRTAVHIQTQKPFNDSESHEAIS